MKSKSAAAGEIKVSMPPSVVEEEEECVTWGPPPGEELGSSLDAPLLASSGVQATIEGDAKAQKRSLIVSMLMLLISIPTLIGAWCWPALVLPLFNVAVTASIRTTGHYISFAVTGGMMLLTILFVAYQAKRRTKMTKLKKWGPTIITACAAFFVIADPLRTIILDSNINVCCITEFVGDQCINAGNASTYYTSNQSLSTGQYSGVSCPTDSWYPYLGKYHIACVGGDINNEAPKCLNAVGIIFTYAITYTGFILLAIGTLWNANIVKKLREIRAQWRALRASRPTRP